MASNAKQLYVLALLKTNEKKGLTLVPSSLSQKNGGELLTGKDRLRKKLNIYCQASTHFRIERYTRGWYSSTHETPALKTLSYG